MDKTVGVLGGGQLGRMFTEAANRLNIRVLTLDAENSPAKQINSHPDHITGGFAKAEDVQKLADKVDVLTIEIEHVNTQVLKELRTSKPNLSIQPSGETISLIQDKYAQKLHLIKKGIDVAKSLPVEKTGDLFVNVEDAVQQLGGYPVMLKARKDAYDGRGNYALRNFSQVPDALETLGDRDLYAEQWANFKMELAVMVVKTKEAAGQDWKAVTLSYPTVETIHEESICKLVYAPARNISEKVSQQAQELARRAIAQFEGKGIFGVEMFLLEDDKLLINEIAPRPHNSGHYTIEACPISQYEAHLRAILDLPLSAADLELDRSSAMLNLLGTTDPTSHTKLASEALKLPRASVHLYGKGSGRPKRKMGHVTLTAPSTAQAAATLAPLIALSDAYKAGKAGTLPSPAPAPAAAEGEEALPLPFGGSKTPVVLVTMGSDSDLKVLRPGIEILEHWRIPHRVTITSAHRTPDRMFVVAEKAEREGIKVVIAAAGGAAHLPGMVASKFALPVIGVPVKGGNSPDGMDALLSIVQMPPGCPVACVGINNSKNAALQAMKILATFDKGTAARVHRFEEEQRDAVLEKAERLERLGVAGYTEG